MKKYYHRDDKEIKLITREIFYCRVLPSSLNLGFFDFILSFDIQKHEIIVFFVTTSFELVTNKTIFKK